MLVAACRKVSRRAEVAWRKGKVIRKNWTRAKMKRGTWRARTRQEGRMGRENPGGRWPRYLMKKIITTDGIGGCSQQPSHVESRGTQKRALYGMVSVDIAKQNARSSTRMWNIKDWTTWKGRHPPK
jgi:hypothetical protein